MKIITWNCQGGFRKKIHLIEALKPDIAVIQECESFEKLANNHVKLPDEKAWVGNDTGLKGVAVFCYNGYQLSPKHIDNSKMSYCMPALISGELYCNLLGIWVKEDKERKISYFGQLHLCVEEYTDFIQAERTIFVGDLNSNKIWDCKTKEVNHMQFVKKMAEKDLVSAYHDWFDEKHGEESTPTFFLYRNFEKAYHLDYCFLPRTWMKAVKKVAVGRAKEWLQFSDHCPLIVEIETEGMVRKNEN